MEIKESNMVTVKELYKLCRATKDSIEDNFRASEEDTEPSTLLTVGTDQTGNIGGSQTGDNSFTGGAYGSPIWAVVYVYRCSNCHDLAVELQEQIVEQLQYNRGAA